MIMKKILLHVYTIFLQLFYKVQRFLYLLDGYGQFDGVFFLFNYQVVYKYACVDFFLCMSNRKLTNRIVNKLALSQSIAFFLYFYCLQ